MKKTALIIMILTIASKLLGFIREVVLSYFFGATYITDAYLISMTIPSIIFGFIAVGIETGYIPIYSKIEKLEGTKEANKYSSNLINLLLILTTILILVGLFFTPYLVKVFASGFEGETLDLAINFTKITLVSMYFIGLISIFRGFLQLKGNYAIPALIGFPMNIITILSIYLSSKGNLNILALGIVLSALSQFLLMVPFAYKKGYRHKFVIDVKDENIKNMVYTALPVIVGLSVNQINVLVDRTIASNLAEGSITALNYAAKLNGFVQGIFVLSITTALYPMISKMVVDNNMEGLKSSVSEAINSINLLVIPATIGSMVFATPIVELVFNRGEFTKEAIVMTSAALFYYSIGMLGFGLREVLSRAFYAMQDTKTPAINAAIAVAINIVLNIVLSKVMGIGGLALATSISAIICTVLLFISLRKKVGAFGMKEITISFVKIVVASAVMGISARVSFNSLLGRFSPNLSLVISIGLGGLIYFIIIYFMKIKEVDNMIKSVKSRLVR